MPKIYPFGYSAAAIGMMQSRTAEANAGFLLAHLSPGMSVLDIGCGPGSITVGIARAVAPGSVVGVDIEPTQVALGNEQAAALQLTNCEFQTASVLALPMADDAFDVVYGHTILMQFDNLEPVLSEVARVLKPGGLIGFREVDLGASLFHSETSAMKDLLFMLRRSVFHNEGNPDMGRSLPSALSSAGLDLVSISAQYNYSSTPEAKAGMYQAMARLWVDAEFPDQAEELGWITPAQRAALPERLEREAADPASFTGTTYVEVVARKP